MTNLGAAKIRKDSLSHIQLQSSSQDPSAREISPSPVLYSSPLHSRSGKSPAGARLSEERARHILKEAPRKRSEPSREEIGQAIHKFKQEQNVSNATQSATETVTRAAPSAPLAPATPSPKPDSESEPAPSSSRKPNSKKRLSLPRPLSNKLIRTSTPIPTLASTAHPTMTARHTALLIASLGNPPPYHSTRHSVAHLVLKHLQNNLSLPPFTLKSKIYGGGHVSHGSDVSRPEFTLWQSPSQMNVSGPPLLKAWKQFLATQQNNPLDPITGLVVLHDEMEIDPGKVKVRRGGNTSTKGHNGIKSVQGSLNGASMMQGLGDRFVKIGIGIGRPAGGSRDTRDVSGFVLGQLTAREKDGLESAARELEGVLYAELAGIGQV